MGRSRPNGAAPRNRSQTPPTGGKGRLSAPTYVGSARANSAHSSVSPGGSALGGFASIQSHPKGDRMGRDALKWRMCRIIQTASAAALPPSVSCGNLPWSSDGLPQSAFGAIRRDTNECFFLPNAQTGIRDLNRPYPDTSPWRPPDAASVKKINRHPILGISPHS